MWIRCAWRRPQIAIVLVLVALFATSAFGQTPPAAPGTIESQIEQVNAENAALREQLRKIEEQQKKLEELIRESQPTPGSGSSGQPSPSPGQAVTSAQPAPGAATQTKDDRYQDGMVI